MNKSEAKLKSALKRKEMRAKGKIERQKIREKANAQAKLNTSASTAQARVNKSLTHAEKLRQHAQTQRALARNATITGSANAIGNAIARSKEAEYEASIAKYAALVTGNTSGTNAIDPGKDGDNGSGDSSTSNPNPRWPM